MDNNDIEKILGCTLEEDAKIQKILAFYDGNITKEDDLKEVYSILLEDKKYRDTLYDLQQMEMVDKTEENSTQFSDHNIDFKLDIKGFLKDLTNKYLVSGKPAMVLSDEPVPVIEYEIPLTNSERQIRVVGEKDKVSLVIHNVKDEKKMFLLNYESNNYDVAHPFDSVITFDNLKRGSYGLTNDFKDMIKINIQ